MDHDAITPKKCLVLTICGAFSHRFFQFLPRFSALCPPLRLQRRCQNLPMLINISICPGGSAQLAIFESSSPPHLLPLKGWYRDCAWAFFIYGTQFPLSSFACSSLPLQYHRYGVLEAIKAGLFKFSAANVTVALPLHREFTTLGFASCPSLSFPRALCAIEVKDRGPPPRVVRIKIRSPPDSHCQWHGYVR